MDWSAAAPDNFVRSLEPRAPYAPPVGISDQHARTAEKLLKESLEEAFHIQQSMLPGGTLRLPSLEVAYQYRPAYVFSGDFLDYFPIGNSNSLGLYIGDVVGKGMPAALYAALAVGTLCGIHKTEEPPNSVLQFLNRRLAARNDPRARQSKPGYSLDGAGGRRLARAGAALFR